MEFLRIENLCKFYGKGENRVAALDHVSLTVTKGEFIAIVGASGSGKSTLLHAIAGVDAPSSGNIYLNGQDVYGQSREHLAIFRRRQIGMVYQFHNLIPTLNVVENITLPVLMDRRKVNQQRLNELLTLLGLEERKYHLPNQLSGGQQQRVAIARAVVTNPKLILADEPTGNLDSKMGAEVMELLHQLNKEDGRTIVMVTHNEEQARQTSRTIRFFDGRQVE